MANREIKQFIVRKYVMAKSAKQAIKLEKKFSADDVWINEEWMKNREFMSKREMGFSTNKK